MLAPCMGLENDVIYSARMLQKLLLIGWLLLVDRAGADGHCTDIAVKASLWWDLGHKALNLCINLGSEICCV